MVLPTKTKPLFEVVFVVSIGIVKKRSVLCKVTKKQSTPTHAHRYTHANTAKNTLQCVNYYKAFKYE